MKNNNKTPTERVSITYSPAVGEENEQVELPFNLLMMGDYCIKHKSESLEQREALSISSSNFGDVMSTMEIEMDLCVPNKLDGEDQESIHVKYPINRMEDFNPDAIVENTPELKQLMALRSALVALKGPIGNNPEFRKKLEEMLLNNATRQRLFDELEQYRRESSGGVAQ